MQRTPKKLLLLVAAALTCAEAGVSELAVLAAVAVVDAGVTSTYQRPQRARDLAAHEVGCLYTNTAPSTPRDDLFRGFACASQAHVALASRTAATVSYVTTDAVPSVLRYRRQGQVLWRTASGTSRSYTALASVDPQLWQPSMGELTYSLEEVRAAANTTSWAVPGSSSRAAPPNPRWLQAYFNPAMIYSSPVIHAVTLTGLEAGPYEYELADGVHVFRMPSPTYPLTLGLTADLGQTVVSNRSFAQLALLKPDVVLISGDLSYADGWPWRWDSFGALAASLLSKVPVLVTGGNHEIGASEAWLHFFERWPTPYAESGSTSPLYWSCNVGPAHVIALNSYDNFVNRGDRLQRTWLETDLARVDRTATPWVIIMMHAPFYNSNRAHALEAELMRLSYEPLFLEHGVDVVLSGHVHSYERSSAQGVYDAASNVCGPVYLNLGDGGNRENTEAAWVLPHPEWSAFRESSFGVGALELINATHAAYAWHHDACGAASSPHYDLDSASCETPHDAGGAPHVAVDPIVLRRDTRASTACAALKAHPPPVAPFPAGWGTSWADNDDDAPPAYGRHERRSVEMSLVAVLVGTACSFLLGIGAAALTSRLARRPAASSLLMPKKGYGLVETASLKRSPDSVVEML